MNCQQFTSLIVESARGRLMDAAARDGAALHLETCAACAARLAQERNLTSALGAFAAGMKDLNAPARVEEKLLAAFRESRAASHAATANALPDDAAPEPLHAPMHAPAVFPARDEVAAPSSSRLQSWRTRSWRTASVVAAAIAASLVLVALVTLYRQFAQTAPPREVTNVSTPQRGDEPSAAAPALATLSPTPPPAGSARRATRDGAQPAPPAAARRTPPRRALAAPPAMIASRQVIDGGRAIFAEGEGELAANGVAAAAAKPDEAESVTEFIPLVAGTPASTPLEGGQLVRVRLPRAALASLGLPLNSERGHEERVSADVLLGNDGMARAIRFVR